MRDSASSRAILIARQEERLRALLAALAAGNAFYGDRVRRFLAGPAGTDIAGFVDRFPLTAKEELSADQRRHPPFGTNLTDAIGRYTRFHQTSGTTGQPLRWLDTPESWQSMVDSWKEVFRAGAVTADDRILFAFSFGPFIGFWLAFAAGEQLGCLCLPGGGLSSLARLRLLAANRVTVLCCTPTYALRLAEVARDENVCPSEIQLQTIIVAGEPGGSIPATRSRLHAAWPGARIVDHHGMTEVGPVTYECPKNSGVLHVIEDAYLAEVIAPESDAASVRRPADGEMGELVLTTLTRVASPLLRYRTGDLVRFGPDRVCECGRVERTLEGGILGRADDMVVVRGVNLYPGAVESVVRAFPEVAEYQVRLSERGNLVEITLAVEPKPDCAEPDSLASQLRSALQTAFALRIPVELAGAGSLPRFEMKARRWTRVR